MHFYIITGGREPDFEGFQKKDVVFLYLSNWDDWFQFRTVYTIYYYDEEMVEHRIGATKMGKVGLLSGELSSPGVRNPAPPTDFTSLDYVFFSLGQDVSYYENLNNLGEKIRTQILSSLNDIAYDEAAFKIARDESVTRVSLLRDVSLKSVEGQFRRLAHGDSKLSPYSFRFTSAADELGKSLVLDFDVRPKSNPPTNIQVIIGRNGVGKTRLINGMINTLVRPDQELTGVFEAKEINDIRTGPVKYVRQDGSLFANLIFVTFSAFDENEPVNQTLDINNPMKYSYVGLKGWDKENHKSITKSADDLKKDFSHSLYICGKYQKMGLWVRTIEMLNSDPIFKFADVLQLASWDIRTSDYYERVEKFFERFSSGHRIVLLTITKIIESIEEQTLVILDEPEGHLHPPLLAAFTRALSNLLTYRNGVGIIATHSPVIVQEVPKRCIWTLHRIGNNSKVERVDKETFGENVGHLTKRIFGLEVTESGFHKLVQRSVEEAEDFDDIMSSFNNELGMEAQAIALTLINQKNS